ncbi:similar to Saccharomyces cerevisiae YLR093C NYV1 v-SNARE component of the vacuolar SNARE complex involved in vesicle fusion [Maudiozyma barnettii]|uniref:Similar to Saccharomyces cerevisiae YLR093C NYV1 v-SNARE component of the vacuolar SNARE complex involved in vesicle fusion n=1 Tax=Maudiozyma barnettii TaxID=61262 RepID=A0A8H2VHE5_9SACH|nr:Nyv1p [Kazachstania barnettii]CAB4255480.1 similar to Saccharomyces cerevisiae YLR093C NYV1 v-SNARE component of the vacuolar SNARE complex involved in vesicle fusion [Kazachstania barnettii]CAD1783963.1 similar to Saccharomyces cerevisiae YLR093C NYV1 v-SNARE component of the vacuolar SNARE complex involved in vesicle fusion [Kazachstania barnettii]
MKRFNITYLEIFKNGRSLSAYFDTSLGDDSSGDSNPNYGSTGTSTNTIKPEVFHKLIQDLVLPKVVSLEGNKVTKVSTTLVDDYDCFYSTALDTNEIYVCFTKVDTPKILPLRILSDLKQEEYKKNDSNIELRVHIGEILDKFHEELLTFKKQNLTSDGTGVDVSDQAEADIQDVIQVMNDNIDKFLQRQERVSLLVDKTSKLNNNSSGFKRKSARINDRLWWQRMKNTTLLIFAIILIVSALFIFYYVL